MNLFKQLGDIFNMKTYHNTVPETGKDLAENTAKAEFQDEIILKHFIEHHPLTFFPEWIWERNFEYHGTPLTSIRRAFSNLQKRGLIEKTGEKVDGMYGRKINIWRLVKNDT